MNERTRQLKRDGLSLTATQYGDEQAPLVILLHGFPDTPYTWDKMLPHLIDAGYQVLTPWMRGYTRGSAVRGARYDLLSIAEDIEAWRQELLIDEVHLVGHDWGAAVVNVLAGSSAFKSKAWRSMSLLAVPPMPARKDLASLLPFLPKQLRYSSYMPLMQFGFSHRLLTRNNADYVARIWRKWSPGWNFTESEFAPTRLVFSDPQLAWAATRYYRNLFRLHDPRVRQAYAATGQPFVVPTIALAGRQDGCMDMRTHQALGQAAMKRGLLEAIQLDDCGHFLQAERPQAVADILLQHFARAKSAALATQASTEGFAVSA